MMLASVVCSSLRDPDRGVRHVSSWGETARVDPDRGACHVSSEKGSLHLQGVEACNAFEITQYLW